jgi:hypothetical protein
MGEVRSKPLSVVVLTLLQREQFPSAALQAESHWRCGSVEQLYSLAEFERVLSSRIPLPMTRIQHYCLGY